MKHELEVIIDKEVLLDDEEYVDCLFRGCTFMFSGESPVTMEACVLEDCFFDFIGPARRTLKFLRNYKLAAGPEAMELLIKQLLEDPLT